MTSEEKKMNSEESKQGKKVEVTQMPTQSKDGGDKPALPVESKEKKQEVTSESAEKAEKKGPRVAARKKVRRVCPEALVTVKANFNNTIVTITDLKGEVLSSSSPGVIGYSGARKSTAYAATRAAEDAAVKAQKYGVREAKVYIKGPGPGRNSAVKGLSAAGLKITLLSDITPLPHNGCRPRRLPRK